MENTPKNHFGIAVLLASSALGLSGCQDKRADANNAQAEVDLAAKLLDTQGADRWRNYPAVISSILNSATAYRNEQAVTLEATPYTVLIFANTNCPLAARYVDKINQLNQQYGDELGVKFIYAFPKKNETSEKVLDFARKYDAQFNVMLDPKHIMADALHAERSPEVFLLDRELKVVYRGAIDDQMGVGSVSPVLKNDYLRQVMDNLLTNKPIENYLTDAEGCFLDRDSLKDIYPTFEQDIAQLVEKHCTYCHRPGDVGSVLELTNFDQISSSAHTIAERTDSRYMPPWRVDGRFGKFKNDARLDVNEIWAFRTWANRDAEKGVGNYKINTATQNASARLHNPDAIVEMAQEFVVPKSGVLPYQHFKVKTNFPEGKWLIASEVRAMAPEVVHHINVFLVRPVENLITTNRFFNTAAKAVAARKFGVSPEEFDGVYQLYGPGMRNQLFLIGNYTPSHTALRFTEEHGVYIPPGAEIVFECHYTPNGIETKDRTALALKFADFVPENPLGKQVITRSGSPKLKEINIAPGESKELTRTMEFHADAKLISLRPHMHLRGKDFQASIERPGEKPEIILSIPEWDYQWQIVYNFAEPVKMPAGTKLHMKYHWDNSEENSQRRESSQKFDPTLEVRFGTKIDNEMGMAWPTYVYENPDQTSQAEELLQNGLTEN